MKDLDLDFFKGHGYVPISKSVLKAQEMMDKVREGKLVPLQTSLQRERDNIGGYYPSEQIVVAGRTGSGKSAKVFHDMLDFADPIINPTYAQDLLILLDSFEMPDWRVILRLASRKGEIAVKGLLDYQQRLTQERYDFLKNVMNRFSDLPIMITSKPQTVTEWIETKKQIQGKYPKRRIMNIFDHTRLGKKADEKREEELITGYMVGGVHLKNEFEMWNMFLSQMNRNIETATNRERLGQNLPIASDIFGSDAVFQCADVVLALHRPGLYGLSDWEGIPTGIDTKNPEKPDTLLIECVLKQREGWTGNILLKHDLSINRVEDWVDERGASELDFKNLLKDDFA
jgi:replicative DNA helicase